MCGYLAFGFSDEYVKKLVEKATGRVVRSVEPCQVNSSATGTQAPKPFTGAYDTVNLVKPNEGFFGVVNAVSGLNEPSNAGQRKLAGVLFGPDEYSAGTPIVPFVTIFAKQHFDQIDGLTNHPPAFFYYCGQFPSLDVLWYFIGFRVRFAL